VYRTKKLKKRSRPKKGLQRNNNNNNNNNNYTIHNILKAFDRDKGTQAVGKMGAKRCTTFAQILCIVFEGKVNPTKRYVLNDGNLEARERNLNTIMISSEVQSANTSHIHPHYRPMKDITDAVPCIVPRDVN
jgi:hypothetical protein